MLVIRLQRTGRKGHATFRIVVQDSRRAPTSGKVIANLGNYDPHTKTINLDKDKASVFIKNGAQPSDRMIGILKTQGVKLPKWVSDPLLKKKAVKSPEKRRSTAPAPTEEPAEVETAAPEAAEAETEPDAEVEQTTETSEPTAEVEPVDEKPAEEAEVTEPDPESKTAEPTEEAAPATTKK